MTERRRNKSDSRARWFVDARDLVRIAREKLNMNQEEFGALVGRSQTLVSKYEIGKVLPPADVLMQCMHVMHEPSGRVAIPISSIVERLTQVSRDSTYTHKLAAIAAILDIGQP